MGISASRCHIVHYNFKFRNHLVEYISTYGKRYPCFKNCLTHIKKHLDDEITHTLPINNSIELNVTFSREGERGNP